MQPLYSINFEGSVYSKVFKRKKQYENMNDVFDNVILCKKCRVEMKPITLIKNGFTIRAVKCPRCGEKIVHPGDEASYVQYQNIRSKTFRVKLRLVGNSYAVSIPKEIVDFMKEQEKIMSDLVKLSFERVGKLALMFEEKGEEEETEEE